MTDRSRKASQEAGKTCRQRPQPTRLSEPHPPPVHPLKPRTLTFVFCRWERLPRALAQPKDGESRGGGRRFDAPLSSQLRETERLDSGQVKPLQGLQALRTVNTKQDETALRNGTALPALSPCHAKYY